MAEATDFNSQLRVEATHLSVETGTAVQAPDGPVDFTFDFARGDIQTFERIGDDLVIILTDGQTARIIGYYDTSYEHALLFHEATEAAASTSGLAVGGLGLAALGGLGAAAAGGGGDGGGAPPTISIVDDMGGADGIVNQVEAATGLTITGTATPNVDVDVTIGTTTESTVADGNGNWTVVFPPSAVPEGEEEIDVTAVATNPYGTAQDVEDVTIDTVVDVPLIRQVLAGEGEVVSGVILPTVPADHTVSFYQTSQFGGLEQVIPSDRLTSETNGTTQFNLPEAVADLLVKVEDAPGNAESHYYIFDDGGHNTISRLDNPSFDDHNVTAVNLRHEEVDLLLTVSDVLNLSDLTDTLVIYGDNDDSVIMSDAVFVGQVTNLDGTFDQYSYGTATILVDDHIPVNNVIT